MKKDAVDKLREKWVRGPFGSMSLKMAFGTNFKFEKDLRSLIVRREKNLAKAFWTAGAFNARNPEQFPYFEECWQAHKREQKGK